MVFFSVDESPNNIPQAHWVENVFQICWDEETFSGTGNPHHWYSSSLRTGEMFQQSDTYSYSKMSW